jgi:hypothetical protein
MGFWENYRDSESDNLLRFWRSWTNENPRWLLMLARVVPKSESTGRNAGRLDLGKRRWGWQIFLAIHKSEVIDEIEIRLNRKHRPTHVATRIYIACPNGVFSAGLRNCKIVFPAGE